jgi:hypothetical protein
VKLVALLLLLPLVARADGLTLKEGQAQATLTVEASLSTDRALEPVSIAPDVGYGVTRDLTLLVVHSGAALTGFRGSAGLGLCLTGEDGGCPHVYRNAGVEALWSLSAGPLSVALDAGLHLFPVYDPTALRGKLGVKARLTLGRLALLTQPSVILVLVERDTQADSLWLPVSASFKIGPRVSLGLGTGVKILDLSEAGSTWQIALGLFGQVQATPNLAVGASFVFGNIAGADEGNPGADARFLQLWVTWQS